MGGGEIQEYSSEMEEKTEIDEWKEAVVWKSREIQLKKISLYID